MTEKEEKAIDRLKRRVESDIKYDCHSIVDWQDLYLVLKLLEQKNKENEELKKYDIRNIKIDKDKIISSPSFTRKEVNLMNLGIALSLNADKLFNEEIEEDDI